MSRIHLSSLVPRFQKRKAISKELYNFCIKERYADATLIGKWKKNGYENLCCLRCTQPQDTNFGTVFEEFKSCFWYLTFSDRIARAAPEAQRLNP